LRQAGPEVIEPQVYRVIKRCKYALMRTTIDMPTALMRSAKARAAEQGESLKDLVN
jgi:hypothetical protein